LGYDFPRENPGSTGGGSLVLFRHFPETPQDDFLTRPIEDDLMEKVVIEAIENRGISHFANLGKTVDDERDLRNITQNEYEMFWATVDPEKPPEERRPIMPVVMPPEEAFKIRFYKNPMVNAFAQLLAFLMGTKGDGVYFPRQLLWKILWSRALGDFYFYGINEGLGFAPVPFSPAVP
jgi:hypothetical protein